MAALIREFEADPAKDLLVIYDELDHGSYVWHQGSALPASGAQRSPQRDFGLVGTEEIG